MIEPHLPFITPRVLELVYTAYDMTPQTETGGLKHNDIAKYGTYRTKDLILAVYDVMAAANAAETPYKSPLTPPPGQGPRHPAR